MNVSLLIRHSEPDGRLPVKVSYYSDLFKSQNTHSLEMSDQCPVTFFTLLFCLLFSGQLVEPPIQLPDLLCSALGHNSAAVRLAAANCLRQLTIVLPNQRTTFLDRCICSLQQAQRTNADATLGYSSAIAGILAGASVSNLGIPANRLRQVGVIVDLRLSSCLF